MTTTKHPLSAFAKASDISVEDFERLCQQHTAPDDYPMATDIAANVLIYDAAQITHYETTALKAEWAHALMNGPGVIVIRQAFSDLSLIDRMSQTFDQICQQEHAQGSGADHFAKAGANSRIWNAFEKSALLDPEGFIHYYKNPVLQLVAESWLGPGYQITAQMNTVHPGGSAQDPHRDYHLGFQENEQVAQYPLHMHQASASLTLQGAVAHSDMPLASGPTLLLPFSQQYPLGYLAWRDPDFRELFHQYSVQLPLEKGDAVFFNPALFHAAGANTTEDHHRCANLLQISAAFGKPMETVDRYRISQRLYPSLLPLWNDQLSAVEQAAILAASCDDYSFPSNLDTDPPLNGMAPQTHSAMTREALKTQLDASAYEQACSRHQQKRRS